MKCDICKLNTNKCDNCIKKLEIPFLCFAWHNEETSHYCSKKCWINELVFEYSRFLTESNNDYEKYAI